MNPHHLSEPRIGLFWFVGDSNAPSRLVTVSSPRETLAGYPLLTIGQTHEDAWPEIQRLDRTLAGYTFDHFPRGRLDFYEPGRRWLFFIDDALRNKKFVARVMSCWNIIEDGHITVQVEPDYRSAAQIRLPE